MDKNDLNSYKNEYLLINNETFINESFINKKKIGIKTECM
jgi:hypothetical protein